MNKKLFIPLTVAVLIHTSAMADTIYCPQKSGFIKTGMTENEVIAACGQPLSKQESNDPPTQKVPVQQLVYTALNTGSVYPGLNPMYYDQWSLPSGSTGINLTVDIINDKVSSIKMNGSSTNAMSVCGGNDVQIGDSVRKLYAACGGPSMVNNTFINQVIPSNTQPEVWIYQVNQYQSPIRLTFVNGKLQSIN
jgi:hypothetical protein